MERDDPVKWRDAMSDAPRDPGAGVGPGGESSVGTPRWVKVFGIIALIVVLLLVILFLTRGPHRGPSRHFGLGELDSAAKRSSSVHVQAWPAGGHG
jgi:hypothetical protein